MTAVFDNLMKRVSKILGFLTYGPCIKILGSIGRVYANQSFVRKCGMAMMTTIGSKGD
jgi:hypothetical protein